MVAKFRLFTLLASLCMLLLAAPLAEAFSGRNGAIVYGWSSLDEPELGPYRYEKGILAIAPRGGEPRTVVGCEQTVIVGVASPATSCLDQTFADPAVSPGGLRIAFDNGASIALVDLDGRNLRVLPAASADDGKPAFSPTGRQLAFAAAGGIWVRDLVTGQAHEVSSEGAAPAWSSRNWIAFERDGQLWRVRPNGKGLQRLTRRGGVAPAWSPHGTKLAFVRGERILILTLKTGRLQEVVRDTGALDVAWSPDGRRLAYTIFDDGIETVRTNGRFPRSIVSGGVSGTASLQAAGLDWRAQR